jgi:hypothetical protein
MTEKKLTKRDHFNALLEIAEVKTNPTLVAFIEHEIELLNRKNTNTERKPTARQIENDGFKADILAFMENGVTYSAGDVVKACPAIAAANLSVSRVAPMLSQLAEAGKLVRTEDKRKSYYTLA